MERTRYIPAIVTLTAGFVVSIITFVYKYSLKSAMLTIALSMVVFFILGLVIKLLVNKFIVEPMIRAMEEEEARLQAEKEEQERLEAELEEQQKEGKKEDSDSDK